MENNNQPQKISTENKPEKSLLLSLGRKGGRGSSGRITIRHRGGGARRLYRIIDFGQAKIGVPGKVLSLEYDPYRTAFIALVQYQDGQKQYILASKNLKEGDQVLCAEGADLKEGNRMKLKNIPIGNQVHNIEIVAGRGGKMVKSAGAAAVVVAQEKPFTQLQMPSGEIRKVSEECFASFGMVSNEKHIYEDLGKAGRSRLKGIRPTVRGSAMNTPDHPHGGGRGKAGIGMPHPKTPWGKPAYGVQTRKRFFTNRFIIKRRVKKHKK